MPYEKPPKDYLFPASTIGSATVNHEIIGPKGKMGTLLDYGVQNPSVLFTNTTTGCQISVGTTADPDAYGDEFDVGALAADSGGKTVRSTYLPTSPSYKALMINDRLPADTIVRLTANAATGGSPAGTGQPWMSIRWDD